MKLKRQMLSGGAPQAGGEFADDDADDEPGLLHDDDDPDLAEFILQMMGSGGGEELPPAPDPSQQQQQFFPGPAGQVAGQMLNGFHGNYAPVQLPSLLPSATQPVGPQSGAAPPPLMLTGVGGPPGVAGGSAEMQPGSIRAAINLRKRPMQHQHQLAGDADSSMLESKPPLSLLLQHQQHRAPPLSAADSSSTGDGGGGGGGDDSVMGDPGERKRQKNAQLARENREKKKQHVQEIESHARTLEQQLAESREREAQLSAELSSAKRHNNYLLSVLYRQSELAAFLATVPALGSRRVQLRQPQLAGAAVTRDTDSQTTTGGICLHLDSAEMVSVVLCDKCAAIGGGEATATASAAAAFLGASQPSSLASLPPQSL